MTVTSERLQKLIAQAGFASRRAAEKLIVDGRVRVNGKVVRELGSKANPRKDEIEVEGFGIVKAEPLVHIALHKPENVVSTVNDPEGRQTVVDLLSDSRPIGKQRDKRGGTSEVNVPRVYPVGRLDFDAEGIILLTNDGDLSNRLMHPRHHVPKTYLVKVKGVPEEKSLERMRRGVRLRNENGSLTRPTKPAEVRIFKKSRTNTWLELTLFEGRNHQVKRMCDAVGHRVLRLIRSEFGGITIDPMPAGAWRFLTKQEVDRLRDW